MKEKSDNTSPVSENINTVIVIGREFGSGGRRIGKKLAARLNFDYFDKELLTEAAREMGFSQEVFDRHDEKKPSIFNAFLHGAYGLSQNFQDIAVDGSALYYKGQSDAIRRIGEKGNCVIVGRTADYLLRDHPGMLSVFLHSPIDYRASRIVERGEASSMHEAIEKARRHDRNRESYYNYYTGRRWGKASNYHLTLDASRMDDEQIIEVIINCIPSVGSDKENK